MFTSALWTKLTIVPDGGLYLSETSPVETAGAILNMLRGRK